MNIKNIFNYLIYGIKWGCTFFVVMNIIVLLSVGEEAMLPADMFIKSALSSMLAGIGGAGTSIVYTFENWSLRKQITTHFIIGLSTYFVAAYIGEWFEFSFDLVFIIAVVTSVFIFWLIWLVFYLINKNDEKNINDKLKEIQQEERSNIE